MRIPRGTINHHLYEDARVLACALLSRSFKNPASIDEKNDLANIISDYFGAENVALYPYARTALYAILKALGLGPGAKILMTPINIFPMREIAEALGITVEFVDIFHNEYFMPKLDDLERCLARSPDCFLLTYLFGYAGKAHEISGLCKKYNVMLVEDISQAIGCQSQNRLLGTFGDAAICSCSITKYVDSYGGAFALFRDSNLARRARISLHAPNPVRLRGIVIKTFAWNLFLSRLVFASITFNLLWLLKWFSPNTFESILGPSIFKSSRTSLPRSYFDDISSFQAQMMKRQFRRLDSLLRMRIGNAAQFAKAYLQVYSKDYLNIQHYTSCDSRVNTFWQILVEVESLVEARSRLFDHGVETGGTNLPLLINEEDQAAYPGAHFIKNNLVFVPSHTWLSASDYAKILHILRLKSERRADTIQ